MSLSKVKKDLKSLVVEDLEKVLKKIGSILNSEASLYNDIIMQQSSLSSLKREINQGTIGNENVNRRQAQIRNATLSIIDDIEEEDVNMAEVVSISNSSNSQVSTNNSSYVVPTNSNSTYSGIYISYAWGGDSEKIVDLLDTELQERSIKVIRDKRDLGYKGSITEFMKDIGKGNKIIVIISKKYLESENCMFELTQVYENKDFAKRIFPIILADADIYKPLNRINYIKYWDGKIKELDQAIKSLERGTDVLDLNRELNNYGKIRVLFSEIAFILKDMNTLSPEIHQGQKFDTLYQMLSDS